MNSQTKPIIVALMALFCIGAGATLVAHPREPVPDFVYSTLSAESGMSTVPSAAAIIRARRQHLVLYLNPRGSHRGDLWLFDTAASKSRLLLRGAIDGDIAPSLNRAAVATPAGDVYLVDLAGRVLDHLPGHGASPKFSPDGSKIAYIRLFDGDLETVLGSAEYSQGVAIYGLESETETLLVPSAGRDLFAVAAWTSDGSRIYYLSSETDINPWAGATWSVSVDGTDVRQETNREPLSEGDLGTEYLGRLHLQLDGRRWLSEIGGEIWLFEFGNDGAIADSRKAFDGRYLQWLDEGKTFAFRPEAQGEQKSSWRVVRLEDLR